MMTTNCKRSFTALLMSGWLAVWGLWADQTWPTDWQNSVPASWAWAVEAWKNPGAGTDSLSVQMAKEFIGDWVDQDVRALSGQEVHDMEVAALKKARLSLDTTLTQYRLQVAQAQITGALPPASTTLAGWDTEDQTWKYFRQHPDEIPIINPMPLKLTAPSDGSLVTPSDEKDPAVAANRMNVDLLFWGQVSTAGRIWSVTIGLWSRLENQNLLVWKDRFAPDEVKQRLQKAHEAFEEVFLGRPWAAVRLEGIPASTIFYTVNDISGSPFVLDRLVPGPFELTAKASGYKTFHKTYVLAPNKTLSERIELVSDKKPGPLISSLPLGADVWVNSRWVGVTPVRVDKPIARESLRVELAGHEPVVTDLEPDAHDQSFLLTPPIPKPDVHADKDRFYLSLAVFSFSLTTTIFAHALADQWTALTNQYATAYLANPTSPIYQNYTDAYQWQQGFQDTAYGGLALTTGVFVWMMIELSTYLQDSEPR